MGVIIQCGGNSIIGSASRPGILRRMRIFCLTAVLLAGMTSGCAGIVIKPKQTEYLDDRTGITVGALKEPVELVQSVESSARLFNKHTSFAYVGPVEWDRMGTISYALWVHIAPGGDKTLGDIRGPGAVTLALDQGPLVLVPMDAPQLGNGPYQPVVSWGQTIYFELSLETLKAVAASQKFELDVRTTDDSMMGFSTGDNTSKIFTGFLHDRGITGD